MFLFFSCFLSGGSPISQVIALGAIRSQHELNLALQAYFASTTRLLLVTADMSVVSKQQVNYLRYVVDEHERLICNQGGDGVCTVPCSISFFVSSSLIAAGNRLVVVLQHLPPEFVSQQFDRKFALDATPFVHGWDFMYVDSLGESISWFFCPCIFGSDVS